MSSSSTLIFGLFSLTDGVRNQRQDGHMTVNTYYTTYQTTLTCINDADGLNAEVRVYSPPSAALYPSHTIVFMYAKIFIPAHGTPLLEAIHAYPFPGDTEDDDYDAHFPELIPSIVVLHGQVLSSSSQSDGSRSFQLSVSEYVRDQLRPSQNITCIFPSFNARWKKMQPPATNTSVQVVASCSRRSPTDGSLEVHVESIMFSVTSTTSNTTQLASTPTKRRKYSPKEKKTNISDPAGLTSTATLLASTSLPTLLQSSTTSTSDDILTQESAKDKNDTNTDSHTADSDHTTVQVSTMTPTVKTPAIAPTVETPAKRIRRK